MSGTGLKRAADDDDDGSSKHSHNPSIPISNDGATEGAEGRSS